VQFNQKDIGRRCKRGVGGAEKRSPVLSIREETKVTTCLTKKKNLTTPRIRRSRQRGGQNGLTKEIAVRGGGGGGSCLGPATGGGPNRG